MTDKDSGEVTNVNSGASFWSCSDSASTAERIQHLTLENEKLRLGNVQINTDHIKCDIVCVTREKVTKFHGNKSANISVDDFLDEVDASLEGPKASRLYYQQPGQSEAFARV